MRNNDNLFQLIKSLTKSEKRYFKIDTQKQGDNKNFIVLFDLIEAQDEYDEEKLKLKLKDNFEIIKNIGSYKNYLFESILECLQNYNNYDSIANKLNKLLSKIKILESKGLYKICMESISKAKKIAIENNLYPQLIKLYATEHSILLRIGIKNKESLDEVCINYGNTAHIYGNLIDYDQLYKKIGTMFILKFDGNEKELEELFNNKLLEDEANALSFEALRIHNTLNAIKYRTHNDYEKVYNYELNKIRDYEKRYHDITHTKPFQYASIINNFLEACINSNILNHINHYLDVLQNLLNSKIDENTIMFIKQVYFLRKLEMLNITKNTEEAILLINEIIKFELTKSELSLNNFSESILFETAKTYFVKADYKNALHSVNELLNTQQLVAEFLTGPIEVLSLMIHFELKNMLLIENSLRNIERKLKKNRDFYKLEIRVTQFFKSIILSREIKFDEYFISLKEDIIKNHPNTLFSFKAKKLLLMPWIENHLHKKVI